MNKQGTILIVDDNKGVLTAVQLLLKNYFTKVITLASPVTLPAVLREEAPESVLYGQNTNGKNPKKQLLLKRNVQRRNAKTAQQKY